METISLQHVRFEEQWKAFAQVVGANHPQHVQAMQDFLLYDYGDPVLKTKCLQYLKRTYPHSFSFQIRKSEHETHIQLAHVPLEYTEWGDEWLHPYHIMEGKLQDAPSLLQMAQEMWLYFLEVKFPFMPSFQRPLQWAAALHYYTLTLFDEAFASQQLHEHLPDMYQMTGGEIANHSQRFKDQLTPF